MGEIKSPEPVKVFCGILFKEENILNSGLKKLEEYFGRYELKSEIFSFDLTDYYSEEMGTSLKKIFVLFENLLSPENCSEWKIFSNDIEKQFSLIPEKPSRQINIDPGYIEMSKVILLTTKNYSHRIYIGKGIYAEVTLLWKNKRFEFLEWTYPDYRTEIAINFFTKARERLKGIRKR